MVDLHQSPGTQANGGSAPTLTEATIRVMHEGDLPWLTDLCKRRYSPHYDPIGAEGWFRNTVLKSSILFYPARTENAFCITMLACEPWVPSEYTANAIFTCAEEGAGYDAIRLLRDSIAWGRMRRCVAWRIWSDTDYDVAVLARRVGATEVLPRHSLRL
jgi:hypothetical protein